jgi:hypothetical protein
MNEEAASMKKLQIWSILSEAIPIPWRNRRHFGTLLIVPIIGFVVNKFIEDNWIFPIVDNASRSAILSVFGQWVVLAIAYSIIFAIFAIACHRSILLGIDAVPGLGFVGWTGRETRFALLSVGLALFTGMMFLLSFFIAFLVADECSGTPSSISRTIPWLKLSKETVTDLLSYGIAIFLVAYPLGRLSLALPATAVDRFVPLKWAWATSASHDARLAFLVGAIPLGSGLLQESIVGNIEEALGLTARHALEAVLYCSLLVVEIAILSICYREIENMKMNSLTDVENNSHTEVSS